MTSELLIVLDLILASLVIVLAIAALHSNSLRQAIILFIVFGLVTALIWARLKAPDVALAEAAIGSGVAGALLLAALRDRKPSPSDAIAIKLLPWQKLTASYVVLALYLLISWAFLNAQQNNAQGLADLAFAEIDNSGVSNPVTAVLLNFRSYDTLLELVVLFAALYAVMVLGSQRATLRVAGPVVRNLVAGLSPLLVITAGYLLWVGAHAPGGAFQAGALLAATAIIIHLSGNRELKLPTSLWLRSLSIAGCAVFLSVGLASMISRDALLQYPEGWDGGLILFIEIFATLSIAASLYLVYLGGKPDEWSASKEAQHD